MFSVGRAQVRGLGPHLTAAADSHARDAIGVLEQDGTGAAQGSKRSHHISPYPFEAEGRGNLPGVRPANMKTRRPLEGGRGLTNGEPVQRFRDYVWPSRGQPQRPFLPRDGPSVHDGVRTLMP